MLRLLFEKRNEAVWISHLDLMRLFQRSFQRAGLTLTRSQGFNPRPTVSIALPLSVGTESGCELLDFSLEGDPVSAGEIKERLNQALISGVRVLNVYENGRKVRDLALMQSRIILSYDRGVPENACEKIGKLFTRDSLTVSKNTKNGVKEQDLIPMIRTVSARVLSRDTLCMEVLHCCQNPTLNPMQIPAAIVSYLPELKPDFCRCERLEIFDAEQNVFR